MCNDNPILFKCQSANCFISSIEHQRPMADKFHVMKNHFLKPSLFCSSEVQFPIGCSAIVLRENLILFLSLTSKEKFLDILFEKFAERMPTNKIGKVG